MERAAERCVSFSKKLVEYSFVLCIQSILFPKMCVCGWHMMCLYVCVCLWTCHGCGPQRVMKFYVVLLRSYICHEVVCQHRHTWHTLLLYVIPFSDKYMCIYTQNIHTCTRKLQGVPERDETGCELQMTPKTELLLSDKWDKYSLALSSLSLSFGLALPH